MNQSVSVPSILPPVVNNALLKAKSKITYTDNVSWVGHSYLLHQFKDYKVIDSAQKVEKNQFKIEANPEDLMIFSFYPTKPVGSIDGGMIVSDDYEKIKYYKETSLNGMSFSKNNWERKIKFPGWKMYMNSFQAFVALENLKKLDSKKDKLAAVREKYNRNLGYQNTSEHLYRIEVKNQNTAIKDMKDRGIACGIHYAANHLNPVYQFPSEVRLNASEHVSKHTLSIPYHELLTDEQTDYIIKSVLDITR